MTSPARSASLSAGELRRAREALLDPVQFSQRVLKRDLWETQRAILRSIAAGPRSRTSVKSCHASGKTFDAADAVLWWIAHDRAAVAVTTSPSWLQVVFQIWGEIRRAVRSSRVQFPEPNQTLLQLSDENFAIGISTNEPERFSGWHGRKVLVVIDEAPGVRAFIHEAIEGIRAGGDVRILELGNPTVPSGPFFDHHTGQRTTWSCLTISAFDTPNLAPLVPATLAKVLPTLAERERDERLVGLLADLSSEQLDQNVRPYLINRRYVLEKWDEWGRSGNPLWDARVMGRFPKQADNALIPLGWLEDAKARPAEDPGGRLEIGIDVAGPGEAETVVYVRCGAAILAFAAFNQPDPRGEVVHFLQPYKAREHLIKVDSIGLGYYFLRHLLDLGFTAAGVNVGLPARDTERFVNRKAELYWALRERAEDGALAGLTDEATIAQCCGILYRHDARGRVAVESKDDIRLRGAKSPDRAEALMLTCADASADAEAIFV